MAISKFTRQIFNNEGITIFGDGSNKRDYTYVSDAVDGFVNALNVYHGYEIYNVGCGNPVQLLTIIQLIENRLGVMTKISYSPMQVGEAVQTYAGIAKAKMLLNFYPKVKIEDGLNNYIDWFLEDSIRS
jgi:UDP-glucuronate 4-epimerase